MSDSQLKKDTVAIGRDGHQVSIVITCADVVSALDLYRAYIEQARAGFVTIDFPVVPRPTLDAEPG